MEEQVRREKQQYAVKRTELLSPAGSFDSARAAVNAGADAIYMGGPFFSARAFAESSAEGRKPDRPQQSPQNGGKPAGGAQPEQEDMLLEALDFCHLRGVKVFMTLNTLLKEREIRQLESYLLPYVEKHLDGVIIQDPGVFYTVRKLFPELELHVSTQAAVTGPRTAARYLELGAKRIVLARELSLQQIRRIYEETGAELEVFAHGALCYSYSGECLMSSFIGGRSGNRGKCAGTCRLPFTLTDTAGKQLNKAGEQYLLSMCDLNTVSRLAEMIDAGVYSFKIEGRMKSPVYTAGITSVYRKYLDLALRQPDYRVDPADTRLLSEVFDRTGTTSGYLDGLHGREMLTLLAKPEFRSHDEKIIGMIREKYLEKDRKVPVEGKIKIEAGQPPELSLRSGSIAVKETAEMAAGTAEKRPVTEADVRDKIERFGGTEFELTGLEVELGENCFVPVKVLNELRRNAADELKRKLLMRSSRDN